MCIVCSLTIDRFTLTRRRLDVIRANYLFKSLRKHKSEANNRNMTSKQQRTGANILFIRYLFASLRYFAPSVHVWSYISVKIQFSNSECKHAIRNAECQSMNPEMSFHEVRIQSGNAESIPECRLSVDKAITVFLSAPLPTH